MLLGINPILNGELRMHLAAMGHSDAVAVVDAHFPAPAVRTVDRFGVYERAAAAFVIVRTGEIRVHGNALPSKGVVTSPRPETCAPREAS